MELRENKNSYFMLDLRIPKEQRYEKYKEELNDSVDLILDAMGADHGCHKYESKDDSQIFYLFRTNRRKRRGQLTKFCQRFLPSEQEYDAKGITRDDLTSIIVKLNKNELIEKAGEPPELYEDQRYGGEDIKFFDDRTKWHQWQKDVYKMLFNEDDDFKKPDPRHIINLIDVKGNSGKSSFFKWLYYKHPQQIGRIGYGTAAQLRSSIVNIGPKPVYIIDLTRSKSKADKEEDLLSILEDTKNGLVINAMYGAGKSMIMAPPHIIVSANYTFNYELLSEDRWMVFEIKSNKKLGKENELLAKQKKEQRRKKQSEELGK